MTAMNVVVECIDVINDGVQLTAPSGAKRLALMRGAALAALAVSGLPAPVPAGYTAVSIWQPPAGNTYTNSGVINGTPNAVWVTTPLTAFTNTTTGAIKAQGSDGYGIQLQTRAVSEPAESRGIPNFVLI